MPFLQGTPRLDSKTVNVASVDDKGGLRVQGEGDPAVVLVLDAILWELAALRLGMIDAGTCSDVDPKDIDFTINKKA